MSNINALPRHSFTIEEILGRTPLRDAFSNFQELLGGKSPEERLEIARQQLQSQHPETLLAVIKTCRITGGRAGPVVPALLKLLTSELVVPYTSIRENGVDNASIACEAAFAIYQIGVAPDANELRRILTNTHRFNVPCIFQSELFDTVQKPYRTVVPAALAVWLIPLLDDEAYELAHFAIPFLNDEEPVALYARETIRELALRARENPSPAATSFIQKLRKSNLQFEGPLWSTVRAVLERADQKQ